MKYLIIILCDSAVPFCHYSNRDKDRRLISIADLRKALFYAMKEGVKIQFVYPDYPLPEEYENVISSVSHIKIKSASSDCDDETVRFFDSIDSFSSYKSPVKTVAVLRLKVKSFVNGYDDIVMALPNYYRVNIVFSDIHELHDKELTEYRDAIENFSNALSLKDVKNVLGTEINIVTDRLTLTGMQNCNAGVDSLTVTPDGCFYICPGFYYDGLENVGTLDTGPELPNRHLYKIDYSPICRKCDAYHCHRCVWLNQKLTQEVNIPGKQQCVVSHHERNASREVLIRLQKEGGLIGPEFNIDEIDYIDPFEKVK